MKKILLIVLFPLLSYSQSSENVNIKTSIETFFDGFHQKDSLLMRSVLHESFKLESVALRDNKVSKEISMEKNLFLQLLKDLTIPFGKKNFFLMKLKLMAHWQMHG